MRWSGQQVLDDGIGADAALPGMRGLLRSVRTPEFAGTVFHEVEAKSLLNRVPGASPMPFSWTVNPYRGCGHACVYCLEGATRVQLADGRTRPIAELVVGDVVVGTTDGADGCRRYVPTEVLAHWSTRRRTAARPDGPRRHRRSRSDSPPGRRASPAADRGSSPARAGRRRGAGAGGVHDGTSPA